MPDWKSIGKKIMCLKKNTKRVAVEEAVLAACDAAYCEVYGDNVPKVDTPYIKAFVRHFTAALSRQGGAQ